jgi:hypothetical protein
MKAAPNKVVLWTVGLVLTIGGALAGLLFAVNRVDDNARASSCQGCLSLIAVAMHRYHEKYGHFPPAYGTDGAGTPAHSWRVLLLEFLNHDLYARYRFDEPWNGPNNRHLERLMPRCYACPADTEGRARWRTNYFVVVGERTVFPGATSISLENVKKPRSSTILLIESIGQDIHWMEPKDLSFDSLSVVVNDKTQPSVSSKHRKGPNVVMVDGTKRRLTPAFSGRLKEMLVIAPSKKPE